jgi:hypothetical protein
VGRANRDPQPAPRETPSKHLEHHEQASKRVNAHHPHECEHEWGIRWADTRAITARDWFLGAQCRNCGQPKYVPASDEVLQAELERDPRNSREQPPS